MNDEQTEQERRAGAIEELRRRVIARPGASKIPAEIDALKFGDSSLTPAQREIISRIPVALSPMNMHQKMSEAEAEIGRLTVERDAARAACELVASSLESSLGYAVGKPYFWDGPEGREIVQHTLRNAANNLREALGSEAGSLQTAVADVNAGRTRPAHELLEELRNESEENE